MRDAERSGQRRLVERLSVQRIAPQAKCGGIDAGQCQQADRRRHACLPLHEGNVVTYGAAVQRCRPKKCKRGEGDCRSRSGGVDVAVIATLSLGKAGQRRRPSAGLLVKTADRAVDALAHRIGHARIGNHRIESSAGGFCVAGQRIDSCDFGARLGIIGLNRNYTLQGTDRDAGVTAVGSGKAKRIIVIRITCTRLLERRKKKQRISRLAMRLQVQCLRNDAIDRSHRGCANGAGSQSRANNDPQCYLGPLVLLHGRPWARSGGRTSCKGGKPITCLIDGEIVGHRRARNVRQPDRETLREDRHPVTARANGGGRCACRVSIVCCGDLEPQRTASQRLSGNVSPFTAQENLLEPQDFARSERAQTVAGTQTTTTLRRRCTATEMGPPAQRRVGFERLCPACFEPDQRVAQRLCPARRQRGLAACKNDRHTLDRIVGWRTHGTICPRRGGSNGGRNNRKYQSHKCSPTSNIVPLLPVWTVTRQP